MKRTGDEESVKEGERKKRVRFDAETTKDINAEDKPSIPKATPRRAKQAEDGLDILGRRIQNETSSNPTTEEDESVDTKNKKHTLDSG